MGSVIRCARCRRLLKMPVKVYGGQPFGDTCARILGLNYGKKRAEKVGRKVFAQLFAEQAGQLPLFEGML